MPWKTKNWIISFLLISCSHFVLFMPNPEQLHLPVSNVEWICKASESYNKKGKRLNLNFFLSCCFLPNLPLDFIPLFTWHIGCWLWSISSFFVRLFAVVDDIFCLFQGHIENVALLKQQYGLNKTANEVIIVIEAYRTLRDRGPYPADQVVRDLHGKFAFVLYDSSNRTAFLAAVSKPFG